MIVSACLIGVKCRYDGSDALNDWVIELSNRFKLIPVCPEQLGGLPTPRKCCEIVGGDGFDVLKGNARVLSEDGIDLTERFLRGAYETLRIAKTLNVERAILKDLSPSCGVECIYDGTFSGKVRRGVGVTTALLIMNGIEVGSVKKD